MQKDPNARIVDIKQWDDYFLLSIESPIIAANASPGQFIMVRVSSLDFPLLRRPLSIHAKKQDTIEIFFQVSGSGTALLSQKTTSDSLDILGPFGQGFSLAGNLKDRKVALIGGGRGVAPLFFLAQELRRQGSDIVVFYGGKSRSDLPLKDKFLSHKISALCSTDDGSFGFHGFVTKLLETETEKKSFEFVYACGPEAMLEKIGQICKQKDIPAEFSLESMMGCGFGACWGCVTKIKNESGSDWQKTCEKGPVFSAENIVWINKDK
ncbi:dihydroorotate dehydrogenase electron transfer subunit [Acidobacteriota bacterium]